VQIVLRGRFLLDHWLVLSHAIKVLGHIDGVGVEFLSCVALTCGRVTELRLIDVFVFRGAHITRVTFFNFIDFEMLRFLWDHYAVGSLVFCQGMISSLCAPQSSQLRCVARDRIPSY
jgi:hypothetical protein